MSAVVIEDGQLLLVRRGRGAAAGEWALPGGRIEPGETVGEAVVRGVEEETSLQGLCGDFVGWTEVLVPEVHAVILTFRLHLLRFEEPVAGGDAAEARWVPDHEVFGHRIVAGLGEFLHDHGII